MTDWTEQELVVGDVRLHLRQKGTGSPVLLLHGVTDNAACWGRTAEALARAHHVVALDLRGHGASDKPEGGYTMADFAGDAAGVIQRLGLAPVAVVGHSLGARIAMTLAATYPELVSRVVLEDPPLLPPLPAGTSRAEIDRIRYEWFQWLRDLQGKTREELIAHRREIMPVSTQEERAAWAESKLQASLALAGPNGMNAWDDWRPDMAGIQCPILLLVADVTQGGVVAPSSLEEVRRLQPQAQIVPFAAGHSIHHEVCTDFLNVILPFLDVS